MSVADICTNYPMDEPDGAKFYIEPYWYGSSSAAYTTF